MNKIQSQLFESGCRPYKEVYMGIYNGLITNIIFHNDPYKIELQNEFEFPLSATIAILPWFDYKNMIDQEIIDKVKKLMLFS